MAGQPTATTSYRPFLNGMRSPVIGPLTRFLIGVPLVLLTTQTATLAVLGFLLLFAFSSLGDVWPWGLNRLAAGAMGQWLLTVAVAMAWAAREGDYARIRVLAPFFPLYFVLALVGVARTSDDLIEGRGTVIVAVLAISAGVFAALMWAEERRYRAGSAPVANLPQPPGLQRA